MMPSTLCGSSALVKMDQDLSPVESSIKTIMNVLNRYSLTVPTELTEKQVKEFLQKELRNFVKDTDFMQNLLKQFGNSEEEEEKINTEELFAMLARMGQAS